MGTDIHLEVEKKMGGEWVQVEPPYEHESPQTGLTYRAWYPWWEDPPPDGVPDPERRCYNLFAFLADVRSGHAPVEPQFAGRGIPVDKSCSSNPDLWLGDHSFTWATLDELLNAPWWVWKPLVNCDFRQWLEILKLHAEDGDFSTVRIVMGFDS